MAVASVTSPAQRRLGRVLCFYSSSGGVGKTLVCANLAYLLAMRGSRVALVDLTLRLGSDLAAWLDLDPDPNFSDLVPAMDTIDPRTLESYLLPHENGLRLLAAPRSPDRWQRIKEGHVEKTVHLLRYRYDFVLIDLATSFDSRVLAVLPISHRIYSMVTPDTAALRNLGELVRLLRLLGYGSRTRLILNRFTGRELLNISEMEKVVGQPFDYMLPEISQRYFSLSGSGTQMPPRLAKGIMPIVEELLGTDSMEKGSVARRILPIIVGSDKTEAKGLPTTDEDLRGKEFRQELQALVHQRVIEQVGPQELSRGNGRGVARAHLEAQVIKVIDDVLAEKVGNRWSEQDQQAFRQEMVDEILGLGHLEVLLRDPEITEIMVNGCDQVYVERRGQLILTDKRFTNDSAVIKIIERIVAPLGRRIDESSPMVDARLPDGSRVNAIIPPLSLNGPMLTIRKFLDEVLSIDDLIGFGSLSEEMAEFLRLCVRARMNLVVSGGTGSGKTTLLNVLSGFIPADERIITIEDAAELRLRQPHVGRLEARPANIEGKGAVSIRDLLRNALRMRPDRIIIGEVRGSEAIDMLQAMNTGH
ncbi:MAG: Flp pilus assembly complex ATPase component TadA, partial [Firmicutes bacterium]|nr:Flp pilus assembly complex ATPase component TadA [Bacillota bacterium]